jgi:hypothetical protein
MIEVMKTPENENEVLFFQISKSGNRNPRLL